MTLLPTASKLSLAARCMHPWSPDATWPDEPADDDARVGSAVHATVEAYLVGPEIPAPDEIALRHGLTPGELRRVLQMFEHAVERVETLHAEGWETVLGVETSYAVDLVTGRARILGHGRAYEAARPSEICGTDDVTLQHRDGRILVADWKTGREARFVRAGASPQMRLLGLAVATVAGAEEVTVELEHLDDDGCWPDRATLDAFDLAGLASDLRALRGEALRPGPWCRRCPMRPVCPATRLALARLGEEVAAVPLEAGALTEEQARAVLVYAPLVRARLDALVEAAESFARSQPIDMLDGTLFCAVEHAGAERCIATPAAVALVRERVGEAALEVDFSQASMQRALRAKAPKGKRAARLREVMTELRGLGAVKVGAPHVRLERRPLLRATEE